MTQSSCSPADSPMLFVEPVVKSGIAERFIGFLGSEKDASLQCAAIKALSVGIKVAVPYLNVTGAPDSLLRTCRPYWEDAANDTPLMSSDSGRATPLSRFSTPQVGARCCTLCTSAQPAPAAPCRALTPAPRPNSDPDVAKEAALALGRLCREHGVAAVISAGAVEPLARLTELLAPPDFVCASLTAISAIVGEKPPPLIEVVTPFAPTLVSLIHGEHDLDVLRDSLRCLDVFADGGNDRIEAVVEAEGVPRIVELIAHADAGVKVNDCTPREGFGRSLRCPCRCLACSSTRFVLLEVLSVATLLRRKRQSMQDA